MARPACACQAYSFAWALAWCTLAAHSWTLARRAERLTLPPPTICETPKITARPGTISLAGGLPPADTFPVRAMREATTVVLRDAPREALAARAAGTGLPTLEDNPCGDLWFETRP
jgi:DNA-binding transcriptional MocR family regulator